MSTQERSISDPPIDHPGPVYTSNSGRGRGCGRGRGRGRGPGLDPSHGWTFSRSTPPPIRIQDEFIDEIIGERAARFCRSAIQRLKEEMTAKGVECTRAGILVLFLDELIEKCTKWLNESINLHSLDQAPLRRSDMLRFIAVLLYSHCTGFSFGFTITSLQRLGFTPPSLSTVQFICTHILAFSPSNRGDTGNDTWNSMRDQTQRLDDFEKAALPLPCHGAKYGAMRANAGVQAGTPEPVFTR